MSAGGGDGSGGEILRLRKELVHAKTQITDLQEELQEKTTLYIQAINVSIKARQFSSLTFAGQGPIQREIEQREGVDFEGRSHRRVKSQDGSRERENAAR